MKKELTYSVESFDESMMWIIDKFGFESPEIHHFYKLGRNDDAVNYALKLGWDIED